MCRLFMQAKSKIEGFFPNQSRSLFGVNCDYTGSRYACRQTLPGNNRNIGRVHIELARGRILQTVDSGRQSLNAKSSARRCFHDKSVFPIRVDECHRVKIGVTRQRFYSLLSGTDVSEVRIANEKRPLNDV